MQTKRKCFLVTLAFLSTWLGEGEMASSMGSRNVWLGKESKYILRLKKASPSHAPLKEKPSQYKQAEKDLSESLKVAEMASIPG